MSLLRLEDLRVSFSGRDGAIEALRGVSLELQAGETLGLVGESGSGKSLTALAVMGLLPPGAKVSGGLWLDQQSLLALPESGWQPLRGARIAMVFQDPMSALNPHLRVVTQLSEVLRLHRGLDAKAATAESLRMLEAVQLPEPLRRLRQYPHELSGGQRQRVMIAMALLCRPQLLIADEPTTALDVTVQAQILKLLADLRRELNLALLFISHDLGVIAELCERTAVMYAGRVVEQGPTAELLSRPAHPYTAGLLACRPSLGRPTGGELPAMPGQPPRPGEAVSGCAFAPRCAQALPQCTSELPLLSPEAGHRQACHRPIKHSR